VGESGFTAYSVFLVIFENRLKKVNSFWTSIAKDLRKVLFRIIWKFKLEVPCHTEALWPLLFIWRPQHFTKLIELVKLRISRKQRLQSIKFCHDTSSGKNINFVGIVDRPQSVFWGSVPPCRDVVGQVLVVI
jgi:hypothetical protein